MDSKLKTTQIGLGLRRRIDLLFGDKMRCAAQLPTLSWHGRSSAVGLPPCSLPPQDLGRVLDGGPIRHGVDSQQLVVPGSPPTACTGIQQGCQLVCPAAGTFWWCWLSPFVLHPAPPMSPHDLLLLKRLRIIPQNSTNCSYLTSYCCTPRVVAASPKCFQQWRFSTSSAAADARHKIPPPHLPGRCGDGQKPGTALRRVPAIVFQRFNQVA